MAVVAEAIANRFLEVGRERGVSISPMKLQKLVYYAHGWDLALSGRPLVNEPIEAWKYGPVIRSLYREFREFGNSPITRKAKDLRWVSGEMQIHDPSIAECDKPTYVRALIDKIWEVYGNYSPIQLSNMTHEKGTPWRAIYDKFGGNIPTGLTIPNEAIREYFASRMGTDA